MRQQRLVVGISGASAPIYGIRTLEILKDASDVETHLVHTKSAERTVALETEYSLEEVQKLADVSYDSDDIAASIASGSFQTMGMIIAPCSVHTMSCIAHGIIKDLVIRAADVTLKEKRPLVLLVRESPLHLGHLRCMVELAKMGATVAPPVPSFYHQPKSADDLVNYSVGRALDIFGLDIGSLRRWSSP